MTSKQIDAVIKNLLTKKSPSPNGCFTSELTSKEELTPIILKFFPKN